MVRRITLPIAVVLGLALAGLIARPRPAAGQDPIPTQVLDPTPIPSLTPTPEATPIPAATAIPVAPPPAPIPRPIPGMDPIVLETIETPLYFVKLQLEVIQSQRLAWGGPLLQLAPTHEQPPDPNRPAVPDPSARVNIDSWYSAGLDLPDRMPIRIWVDVYQGPGGWGYVIQSEMTWGGQRWRRSENIGPESWRDRDWHYEPSEEL